MKRSYRSYAIAVAMLATGLRWAGATTVIGDLNNFDTVNDTGQTCYGFEIEIDDVRSTDITYTFDWNHYGPPKIREDNADPLHPKVFVRYESTRDANGTWGANGSFTNQVIPTITPPSGHSCTDTSVNEGCEHFGVGYYGVPSAIRYTWLVDGGGALVPFGAPVSVATPSWVYTPPDAGQPAQVVAVIPAPVVPIPAGKRFGEATWVKVVKTTTHNPRNVALVELVSDDVDGDGLADWQNQEPDEVETEWKLLQTNDAGNGAKAELQGGADDMGDGSETVTRRYEFYRYGASIDTIDGETGEAMCDEVDPTVDPNAPNYLHGLRDHVAVTDANGDTYFVDCTAQVVVGTFIGAQMAGFDAEAPLGLVDHLQDADKDNAYTARTVVVGGNSPFTITVTNGSLPDGMVLGDYLDPDSGLIRPGVLSGTPVVGGDFAFTVAVVDASNATTTRDFTLHVAGGDATTTTTTPSTTTTTTTLPPLPSCTMGAGLPQTPPRPAKYTGQVKIGRGLTNTPAIMNTKLKISGTLEHCANFPDVPGAAGPITAGRVQLSVQIPAGSTCAAIASGMPLKSTLSIVWTTPDPSRPGKFKRVGREKTTLTSFGVPSLDPIVFGAVSGAFGPRSVPPGFPARHAEIVITTDQTAEQIAAACAGSKGLTLLTFTGGRGPSTIEIP